MVKKVASAVATLDSGSLFGEEAEETNEEEEEDDDDEVEVKKKLKSKKKKKSGTSKSTSTKQTILCTARSTKPTRKPSMNGCASR
jgi:hypothetical protein